ncbi:hypothetical protein FB567DRAFT_452916 [Paraphoma chrysanthemicola]|uniref:DUF1917-domain-containing protein n=1 Tax=Paraphoma chrysanthemicola TaxID=798071 RepID=A0A8K0VTG7_9PLEO|nr:hypothetical protein FB567DRAFT_452916 [Paraphoma chrysanthemicola]
MAEEDQVSGEGWISDDSSFYGDEDEQYHQHSLCNKANLGYFWSAQKSDLNAILALHRARTRSEHMPSAPAAPYATKATLSGNITVSSTQANGNVSNFMLERRAMEEARLARLGKRKREPSPVPELFNPAAGSPDAWQLGESVDDFVGRLPPLTTPVSTCPWIWAHNPHRNARDRAVILREDDFRRLGRKLLGDSLQTRERIQATGKHGSRAAQNKSLSEESKALQQHITDLAAECGILSGKWMLFPSLEDVTRVWKAVVRALVDGRLGSTAKVATDEGTQGDRLICIYTKDFRDEDDVLRALKEIDMLGLLPSGRSIYYKSDAFTYLDLYKETAAEYGLQASLYTSSKMIAAGKVSKAVSGPMKRQSTLNNYF